MTGGGTYGDMHAALDGLLPHAAVAAVAAEFPDCNVHESPAGAVWAETPCPADGAPIYIREPDAIHMWQALAEYEWARRFAAQPLHGHPPAVAS